MQKVITFSNGTTAGSSLLHGRSIDPAGHRQDKKSFQGVPGRSVRTTTLSCGLSISRPTRVARDKGTGAHIPRINCFSCFICGRSRPLPCLLFCTFRRTKPPAEIRMAGNDLAGRDCPSSSEPSTASRAGMACSSASMVRTIWARVAADSLTYPQSHWHTSPVEFLQPLLPQRSV